MLKGIKLKFYPNAKQKQQLDWMFGNDRFVWNEMLNLINQRYKNNPSLKILSAYDMQYLLKPLKQEYTFLKESDSSSLQVVTNNLYQAWLMFFKRKHGRPRFHSRKACKQSYTG
ncbi:helix-turn-helix domain-containing protein, partial [Ligilactobacillus equi]